jgi:Bacteriophage probable baseplate hub protein
MATLSIPAILAPFLAVSSGTTKVSLEAKADIISVEVNEDEDCVAMASVKMNFWDGLRQRIKQEYLTQFQLGTPLEVTVGSDKTPPIFIGEVTALEASFGSGGSSDTLTVQAYNRLHRLTFGTKQRTFQKVTYSEIASRIADEAGLAAEVEDTVTKQEHVTQDNVNNLSFLLSLKPNNYEVKVEDKTLFFRTTREPLAPVFSLACRSDRVSFAPRLRAVPEGGKVEVRGWDIKTKKPILGKAGSGDETTKMGGSKTGAEISSAVFAPSTRTITDQTVMDADEAQRIARACYNWQQRDFVEAAGECVGIPAIRVGKTIKITEIGELFDGIYYVTSATHSVGPNGYRTSFKVRRNAV